MTDATFISYGDLSRLRYRDLVVGVIGQPEFLTKHEAAARARVSVRTIERATLSGELESVGGWGLKRYKPAWVDEWLERRNHRQAGR
jgi:hypothetical protein